MPFFSARLDTWKSRSDFFFFKFLVSNTEPENVYLLVIYCWWALWANTISFKIWSVCRNQEPREIGIVLHLHCDTAQNKGHVRDWRKIPSIRWTCGKGFLIMTWKRMVFHRLKFQVHNSGPSAGNIELTTLPPVLASSRIWASLQPASQEYLPRGWVVQGEV